MYWVLGPSGLGKYLDLLGCEGLAPGYGAFWIPTLARAWNLFQRVQTPNYRGIRAQIHDIYIYIYTYVDILI